MMKFFITGTNRGIGKALSELILEKGHQVYGIGRKHVIQHDNYVALQLDLSDSFAVKAFRFPEVEQDDEIVLINNAGILGDVAPLGEKQADRIDELIQVNVTAPIQLCNTLLKQNTPVCILNISSGAGRGNIHSWTDYSASKAALDRFSEVLQLELYPKTRVYSVAPAIVETGMQEQIRSTSKAKFPDVERFVGFHADGELLSSEEVAVKLLRIVQEPETFKQVICSVRDF